MAKDALLPSPQTTLVIVLGASEWPFALDFPASAAFENAARSWKSYILDPQGFGVPCENLLDLFNSSKGPLEIDEEINIFLEKRSSIMKASGNPPRDILLYFVGHGGFVGRDSDFYLALRCTRRERPRTSGIQIESLADTLSEKGRHLRRFIILDCCFAAAAFRAFETGTSIVAISKMVNAFKVKEEANNLPSKGVALLCSSDQKTTSLVLPDGSSTMFSRSLMHALSRGNAHHRNPLSLYDLKNLAEEALSHLSIKNAPRPVVFSPDQSKGDIAAVPLFPNPTAKKIEEVRDAEIPSPSEEQWLSNTSVEVMKVNEFFARTYVSTSLSNIKEKYAHLLSIGTHLGDAKSDPIMISPGNIVYVLYDLGAIVDHRQRRTYVIQGPIYQKWLQLGWEQKEIFPVEDDIVNPDGVGSFNHFRGTGTDFQGSIYWHPNVGAYSLQGEIREKWLLLDWEGYYPISDERTCLDGFGHYNDFRSVNLDPTFYEHNDLSIYHHPMTGVYEIHGAIRAYWKTLGGAERYGYPTTDEMVYSDGIGRFSKFHRLIDDRETTLSWYPGSGVKEEISK